MARFKTLKSSEADYQVAFFGWVDFKINQGDERYKTIFHAPKVGGCRLTEGGNLKRQGVADIFIDYPNGGYHGLRIEMKVGNNKLTMPQIDFLETERANGYKVAVCYSSGEAIDTVEKYFR